MTEVDNFQFWCPLEFKKAIDETTGEEVMRLGGIASTADEDSDGEYLDPKGFDIKPLMENGMVNWHHQAKTSPGTIVGEPHKAEIRKDGLYIETDLYPSSQVARDIWSLAKTLDKDSKTRRLGYSIEGRVLKRKSNDKDSPDYKKITKAVITGVAITHMPKNPKTFANIIKGDVADDFDEEEVDTNDENNKKEKDDKKLDTKKGRALIKEDVDKKIKVTTFSKSQVMECLFKDIPGIDIEKADKIYLLISKISNMAKKKMVDNEDISKAYEALGIPSDIEKAEKSSDDASEQEEPDGDEEKEEEPLKKAKASKAKVVEPKKDDDEDEEDDDEENDPDEKEPDNDEDDVVEESKKEVKKGNENKLFARFDRLEEISVRSHTANTRLVKALGVMVKDLSQKLEKSDTRNAELCDKMDDLLDINKGQEDTINMLSEKLEEYGSQAPSPKSIRHAAPVERQFAKANDDSLKKGGEDDMGVNRVSIKNTAAVSEILDQATFNKGYDEEFSKACTHFEATKDLPVNIISRIKNEFGIEIVK